MSSPDQIRMEDIEKKMKEFKQSHEHALLKSKDNPFNSNYDKRNTFDTSSILKLLNVECVIVPVAFNLSSINCQYALVANYLSNSAEIGFIEAHGGLWKLIQRKDGIPGVRVILQAAEIGESALYLDANLKLIEKLSNAAVWNVKVLNISNRSLDVENEIPQGALVQFELISQSSAEEKSASNSFDSLPPILMFQAIDGVNKLKAIVSDSIQKPPSLSEKLGHAVSVNSESLTQKSVDQEGNAVTQVLAWELIPESWISDDFSFLEGHIN